MMKTDWNEQERLAALDSYGMLDTPFEDDFDDIVLLASQICDMPVSTISLVASKRQWFKARTGITSRETPIEQSICAHAILQEDVFIVPDTTLDDRFKSNPLVTGDPHVRFYAGAVLESPEGLPLGTLCVLDYKTGRLTQKQAHALKALARQVMGQLNLRRSLREKKIAEDRLKLAVESSGYMGTWDWDIVRNRVFSDGKFASLFKIDALARIDGCPLEDYFKAIHPDDTERVKSEIEEAIEEKTQFACEYRLIGTDGYVRWVNARGRCYYNDEGKAIRFPGVALDITERVEGERLLIEAENEFRQMTNALPQTVWTARPDGNISFINERGYEYIGNIPIKDDELDWLKVIHPDDHANSVAVWTRSVTTGAPFQVEQRIYQQATQEFRWNLSRAMAIRDKEGRIVKWFGTNTDISELKEVEDALQKAQASLAQQNMELDEAVRVRTARLQETVQELEAFSFSISHDMRSPLRAMHGYSEALLQDYADRLDADATHYLQRIHRAAGRLDLLIRDVLAYSKVSRSEVELNAVDFAPLVEDIVQSYPNLDPANIHVSISPVPLVAAHEGFLTQVISNLLGNAIKFATPGIFPAVRIYSETTGDKVIISFQDNGIGIDPQHFQQIFQIFGRVYHEKQFEGTGIGLAIVRKATERMGGSCGVEAVLGGGSRFWIALNKCI